MQKEIKAKDGEVMRGVGVWKTHRWQVNVYSKQKVSPEESEAVATEGKCKNKPQTELNS